MKFVIKMYVVKDSILLTIRGVGNNPVDLEVVQEMWATCTARPHTFWFVIIKYSPYAGFCKVISKADEL